MVNIWALSKTDIYLGTTPIMAKAEQFYGKKVFQEISLEDLPENFSAIAVDKWFYRLMV